MKIIISQLRRVVCFSIKPFHVSAAVSHYKGWYVPAFPGKWPSELLATHMKWPGQPKKWMKYNEIVYPPTEKGEQRRPAEVCFMKENLKGSPKKVWHLAQMIRGLSIDEAIRQMSFHKKLHSKFIKQALVDAQKLAVEEHNVEFKSNLWVESSFVTRAPHIKGLRKLAKGRVSIVKYHFCHYFVRLREGKPPEHYYPPPLTGNEKMEDFLNEWRNTRVFHGL